MNILITGASSGIGKATAEVFINAGHNVINLSRTPCSIEKVQNISCDITDSSVLTSAFEQITSIDLVINNAGFGISGAIEYSETEEIEKQFSLNTMAHVAVIQKSLPFLKKSKGRIINITSAAAVFPIPFQAFYSATKASMESISMALANELKPFGVSVCAVRLGDVKTGFTAARHKNAKGNDEYGGAIARSIAVMENGEQNGMKPQQIGEAILKLSAKKHVPPIVTVGSKYKFLCFLERLLPKSATNRLLRIIYIPSK